MRITKSCWILDITSSAFLQSYDLGLGAIACNIMLGGSFLFQCVDEICFFLTAPARLQVLLSVGVVSKVFNRQQMAIGI